MSLGSLNAEAFNFNLHDPVKPTLHLSSKQDLELESDETPEASPLHNQLPASSSTSSFTLLELSEKTDAQHLVHCLQLESAFLTEQNQSLSKELMGAKMTIAALKSIVQQKEDELATLRRFNLAMISPQPEPPALLSPTLEPTTEDHLNLEIGAPTEPKPKANGRNKIKTKKSSWLKTLMG